MQKPILSDILHCSHLYLILMYTTILRIILWVIPLLLLTGVTHTFADCDGWFQYGCEVTPPYCTDGKCTLSGGVNDVWGVVDDLITDTPLSEYAQTIVIYFLSFISLIAVIYIIYAGFQVLIWAWDEEKMKKAKNIILYVIIGIVLMWLSYSIVYWIIDLVDTTGGTK